MLEDRNNNVFPSQNNGGEIFNLADFGQVKTMLQKAASATGTDLFAQVFGDKANTVELQAVRSQWAVGDFTQLPSVQILSAANMHGADGAYASSTKTVYLSDSLFKSGAAPVDSLQGAAGVWTEEIFHWVDDLVGTDTKGDEGEYAKDLLFGINLTQGQITTLKAEDDRGFITVNGQLTAVELSSPSDFGINLNSASYTQAGGNVFISGILDQCTEFAFGRALEKGLINSSSGIGAKIRGNAGDWDNQAGSWSNQARANSFVVWDPNQGGAGGAGHVAFVERVNADGTFVISEFNWNYGDGKYNSRTIYSGSQAFNTAKFIYLESGTSQSTTSTVARAAQENTDINGDGIADIVGFKDNGVYTSLSNGDGTFAAAKFAIGDYSTQYGWTDSNERPRLLADINGDGKADIVGFKDTPFPEYNHSINSGKRD